MKTSDLIRMRKIIGLTQKEVAHRALISRSFYTKIESGKRRPSPEVAFRIGRALGLSKKQVMEIFFEDAGDEMSHQITYPTKQAG